MVVLRRAHQHWRDRIGVREVCEGLIVGRPRQSPEHQLGGARDPNGRVEAGLVVLVSDLESIQLILVRVLPQDRKSTRLNSSHVAISYAVFCLKKKRNN